MITLFGKRFRLFRPRSIWIRKVVQWAFFALIALIAVNHSLAESGTGIPFLSSASLHAICPFGGVVSIYQFATLGTFVQKIHEFVLRADGDRTAAGSPVRAGFLWLGLSLRHHSRTGFQVWTKILPEAFQSLCPDETG